MQCTNCGFTVAPEDNVCSNCGHILKSGFSRPAGIPSPQYPPGAQSPQPASPPAKRAISPWVLAAGLVVLGVCVVVGLVLSGGLQGLRRNATPEPAVSGLETSQAIQELTAEAQKAKFEVWVDYVRRTDPHLTSWDALVREAQGSNRISMPEVVDRMIAARASFAALAHEAAYESVHLAMLEAMQLAIDGFSDWQAGGTSHERLLAEYQAKRSSWIELVNAIEH